MIVYYKAKGKPSGQQPKVKQKKKQNTGFSIVLRDKSKSAKGSKAPVSRNSDLKNEEKIKVISSCIEEKSILEFDYCDKKGTKTTRLVEPMEVRTLNGAVVLYAFCLQNEGIRVFVLSNMQNLKKSELNGRNRK